MENSRNYKDKESGRVIGGLILVLVGAALLLRNTGFYMPGWIFSWPMILILVGIYTGFKHNFRNNSWIIIMAVGVFFLLNRFIPTLHLEPLFWPILIMGLGILFIIKPRKNDWFNSSTEQEYNKLKSGSAEMVDEPVTAGAYENSDHLVIRSVFSGVNRNVVSKNFKGGHISSVFGGAEVNLTQSEISGQVILKLEVVFGGVKLIVPPHWAVQNEIDGFFHGVDDKRSFNPSASINPDKVLVLKGSAVFGGIEIKSY